MKTWIWLVLAATLFYTTFGFSTCVTFFGAVILFLLGGFTYIYICEIDQAEKDLQILKNYIYRKSCLQKVAESMKKGKKKYNFDTRLTGSHIIDEELQTILYYIFRDFIYPWYDKISDDQEFPYQLKETFHKVIITLSNRIKEVDWIPYFTTQLVDDVASHLRLYKQARAKSKNTNQSSLETHFFDLEFTMEHSVLCRDHICINSKEEKNYMDHVIEAVLFQLLPESDFECKPFRLIATNILSEVIFLPFFTMVSDPDYANQTIIWLCSDFPVSSEIFLTVIKTTNSIEELYATRISVHREIASLRCRDAGTENDSGIKSQLNSLLYLDKIIDVRLNRLQEGSDRDSTGLPSSVDYSRLFSNQKLVQLPLDFIFKNNIALSYFIDYMSFIGYQNYIFAYLNMEGWKLSAKQELLKISSSKNSSLEACKTYEQLKNAALLLYNQYLSEKISSKLINDSVLTRSLYVRMYTEIPVENWFDDVLHILYTTLQNDEKFLQGFRNHPSYVKLLAELELLKETMLKESEDDDILMDELLPSSDESSLAGSPVKKIIKDTTQEYNTVISPELNCSNFTLSAKIIETGLVQENGKTFGVYAVAVTKLFEDGRSDSWHIYRRYSDFYELHQKLKEKYPDLSQIPFPGKKAFNNIERIVLEKRMRMLNDYMKVLLQLGFIKSHPLLQEMLMSFFEIEYDKADTSGPLGKTIDNLIINPLKLVGNAVKTMPDNLLNTVDGVMEGFSRVFSRSSRSDAEEETMKVSSEIDVESDNVPLRIMLLLMMEVFDLKTRNQWLRKRIIMLLRQIMHAMFGDIVNKRILDYVAVITSPSRVALCLANIKNSVWPNSTIARPMSERDNDLRMQTRVSAKCVMLASLSDELKHLLGSETSRSGLMLVFSMFQHEVLNKRLLYVIMEGFLITLFPNLNKFFERIHSHSPRVLYSRPKEKAKK